MIDYLTAKTKEIVACFGEHITDAHHVSTKDVDHVEPRSTVCVILIPPIRRHEFVPEIASVLENGYELTFK